MAEPDITHRETDVGKMNDKLAHRDQSGLFSGPYQSTFSIRRDLLACLRKHGALRKYSWMQRTIQRPDQRRLRAPRPRMQVAALRWRIMRPQFAGAMA